MLDILDIPTILLKILDSCYTALHWGRSILCHRPSFSFPPQFSTSRSSTPSETLALMLWGVLKPSISSLVHHCEGGYTLPIRFRGQADGQARWQTTYSQGGKMDSDIKGSSMSKSRYLDAVQAILLHAHPTPI
ncbi:hypothetical protein PM082_010976 [Marasmius tenuissimus]|nr:hypothetical protein PM082_010976 [Marasmius tenuissimus]